MKKFLSILSLSMIMAFGSMSTAEASTTKPAEARAQQIIERVHEIKTMDFSKMPKAEQQEVKDELKGMKKEIKSMEGLDSNITISLGALIIIILLLIILL